MHPILFKAGGFTVYSYGFFVALSMVIVLFLADRMAKRAGLSEKITLDFLFVIFLSGIAGARLLFVIQHFEDYRTDPLRALAIQEGGLVYYGGLLAAVLVGGLWAARKKWPLLKLLDFFAPLLLLAHAIGRIGCFLNGCCYGAETDLFLGVVFYGDDVRRHPVQIYESILLLVLFFILYGRSRKVHPDGMIFSLYLMTYGVARFALEGLRGDQDLLGAWTLPQWMSLIFLVAGLGLWLAVTRKQKS
ncbi:MAG TPA: prolipoprotein diacylglyceryl transferase [Candidatus Omnitrophota bacterium]|nr:prolipoprotein diacylglyceryl transferase [Candidatus Omnitrophota bacterium]